MDASLGFVIYEANCVVEDRKDHTQTSKDAEPRTNARSHVVTGRIIFHAWQKEDAANEVTHGRDKKINLFHDFIALVVLHGMLELQWAHLLHESVH